MDWTSLKITRARIQFDSSLENDLLCEVLGTVPRAGVLGRHQLCCILNFNGGRGPNATELAKKVCPRLRDSACWRSGEITQPRTKFLANSVQWCSISVVTWLKGRACMQCDGEKVNTPLFVPTCSNGNANDYREQSVLHMSFVDLGL